MGGGLGNPAGGRGRPWVWTVMGTLGVDGRETRPCVKGIAAWCQGWAGERALGMPKAAGRADWVGQPKLEGGSLRSVDGGLVYVDGQHGVRDGW